MMEWIQNVFAVLKTIEIRDIIDILAIAFIIFSLFKLVKETRAAQLLKGCCCTSYYIFNIITLRIDDAYDTSQNIF